MEKNMSNWNSHATELVRRLKTDRRNALMLKNPWTRAVQTMVNGWRIRLSRPPLKGNVKDAARPNWKVFALRGVGILASKKYHASQSDWKLWVTRRMTAVSRYIPKSKRTWQSGQPVM